MSDWTTWVDGTDIVRWNINHGMNLWGSQFINSAPIQPHTHACSCIKQFQILSLNQNRKCINFNFSFYQFLQNTT